MSLFIIGSILFGAVLAQFFKFYILLPACVLVGILSLTSPFYAGQHLATSLFSLAFLLTSVQFGYLAGLVLRANLVARGRGKRNTFKRSSLPSHSLPSLDWQSLRHRRARDLAPAQPTRDHSGARVMDAKRRIGPAA
jgi:hypothetical protein